MNSFSEKSNHSKNNVAANFENPTSSKSFAIYRDNSSSSAIQTKMQALANQSPQVNQLKTWQQFVNKNYIPAVKQLQKNVSGKVIQRTIGLEYDDDTGEELKENRLLTVQQAFDHLTQGYDYAPTERLWVELARLSSVNAIFSDTEELIEILNSRGAFGPDYEDGFYAEGQGHEDEPQQDEEEEEVYYINENEAMLLEADFQMLNDLIDRYDVALDGSDFGRGSSMGSAASEVNVIGVGLIELASFVKSNRMLARMLDNSVLHPGKGGDSRSKKYGGRSFMQILAMAAQGNECHNDLAEALRECLSGFKKM